MDANRGILATGIKARILIADDDRAIRLLLRRMLELNPDWRLCGEASNGPEAIEQVLILKPEVALIDLAMPGMNGLQVAQEIKDHYCPTSLLLVSVEEVTWPLVQAARGAGFAGAITKSSGQEVILAVEALLRCENYFVLEDSQLRIG